MSGPFRHSQKSDVHADPSANDVGFLYPPPLLVSLEEDKGPDHDVLASAGAVGSRQAVWNGRRRCHRRSSSASGIPVPARAA